MPRSLHFALAAATVTASLLAAGSAAADPPPPAPPPGPLIVAPGAPPGPPVPVMGPGIGLSSPSPVNPLAGLDLLSPNGFRTPSDDVLSPYALESGVPPGPFARLSAFNGVQAILRGTLGRMPGAELGEAMPGTAPPPGTRIPPGLEQFYVDPNLPPPPGG